MPVFPSLEWCRALAAELENDPAAAVAAREWGGRSVGVVLRRPPAREFCVFVRPHPSEPRPLALIECEDEDDLMLEEPDFVFHASLELVRDVLAGRADPIDVLVRGSVKVEGDLKTLITFGTRHRAIGETVVPRVPTTF